MYLNKHMYAWTDVDYIALVFLNYLYGYIAV